MVMKWTKEIQWNEIARAAVVLGLVSPTLLARADEVIE
jgi:hypothetical protein